MRAAVLTGVGEVTLEDRPQPEARPGWVVVRVGAASICGTDTHQYEGRVDSPFPRVPGHDFAGTVDALGEGVDASWAGRRVAVKPSMPCGSCTACGELRFGDCPTKKLMGLWSDGCFTERVAVPAVNLVPLPDDVEFWQASLLEPIAVGLNTVDRLPTRLGDRVLVLGQGPIGLAITRLAALSGAGRLVVTDVRDEVFAIALAYGATDCVDVATGDLAAAVANVSGGAGMDIVIETSGAPAAVAGVLDFVRKEGTAVFVGFANDLPGLPVVPILLKTLTVLGIGGNGGRGQYERSLELVATGRIDLAPLVTHRMALDDAPAAFAVAAQKTDGAVKVVLAP